MNALDFINSTALRDHLEKIGYRFTYHEQPGIHNWDFWDDEIKRILEWLPIDKKGEHKYL